jgi:hypothetical protein
MFGRNQNAFSNLRAENLMFGRNQNAFSNLGAELAVAANDLTRAC